MSQRSKQFNWNKLERKWQKKWVWTKIHEANPDPKKKKYFVTAAYPYPNSPQHIGHARTYTLADVNARYHRMLGYNVLFPMGFHYTGAPLFAMAKRLNQNDPEIIQTFTQVYKIPESKLDSLKKPLQMAEYFRHDIEQGMVEMGFSIDWRRQFTTADTLYNRFIEWHFRWLRHKGVITQGTHPVAWCPNDQNPVGTVDTQGDVEPEIGEEYLIKFEHAGIIYPTATLRPETIFGVTNLWINPESEYVNAVVDGENWIISTAAIEKLEHQNHKVEVKERFLGKQVLTKIVVNPLTKQSVPILPASFVDPNHGTGVVMSVPAHAPYDYVALIELKNSLQPQISLELLQNIVPVSIIEEEGFLENPAKSIVEKFQVRNQDDPKLLDATKELYLKELRTGKMKANLNGYSGKPVSLAREEVAQELQQKGYAKILYELTNGPITCRCGTKCLVHIVHNQWFINYGDSEWKQIAHKAMDKVRIFPEERRSEFNYTVDWLRERACARKVGLGTQLPWDQEWTIEALSDSVIYMAYYILAKYYTKEWMTFQKFQKNKDQLTDSFYNYVLLGQGSSADVAKDTGISRRTLDMIRKEFLYFYPVDMRHSGKDLVTNHLTFYVFHHALLFPPEHWPKGIVANGFVLMDGEKMSKSLNNIIPLRVAYAKYGADPLRIGVLSTAGLNQDTDFSENLASSLQERLVNIIVQSKKIGQQKTTTKKTKLSSLDYWILGRLNQIIDSVTSAMDELRLREAINMIIYQIDNDVAWYQRRLGPVGRKRDNRNEILRRIYKLRAQLLSPIAPHTAEEVWYNLGEKSLVAISKWPIVDKKLLESDFALAESVVTRTLEDTMEILKATDIVPKRVLYYTAAPWKWTIYKKALEYVSENGTNIGGFIKQIMSEPTFRSLGKQALDYANKSLKQAMQMDREMRQNRLDAKNPDEQRVLEEAREFYSRELKVNVTIIREDDTDVDDPKGKASLAEPYRPAIYVEGESSLGNMPESPSIRSVS